MLRREHLIPMIVALGLLLLASHTWSACDGDNPCTDPGTGGPCEVWNCEDCSYDFVPACDTDGDGVADACYTCDTDGDGVADSCYACDSDGDGVADSCYACDSDGDGVADACYTCDTDGDGVADACYTCDTDGDGEDDSCYVCDSDEDGIKDMCPAIGGLEPLNLESEYCFNDGASVDFMVTTDTCCPDGTFIPAGTVVTWDLPLSPCGGHTETFDYECLSVDISYTVLDAEATDPVAPEPPDNESGDTFASFADEYFNCVCTYLQPPEPYWYCHGVVNVSADYTKSFKYTIIDCRESVMGSMLQEAENWSVVAYSFVWSEHFAAQTMCSFGGAMELLCWPWYKDECVSIINGLSPVDVTPGADMWRYVDASADRPCEYYKVCFWKMQARIDAELTTGMYLEHEDRHTTPPRQWRTFAGREEETAITDWMDVNDGQGGKGNVGYKCN